MTPDFLLDAAQKMVHRLPKPLWLVQDLQQRIILWANHVLNQNEAAKERLKRHVGKTLDIQAEGQQLIAKITPAGLLEWIDRLEKPSDLLIELPGAPWSSVVQKVLKKELPDVRIQGDVMLAAEMTWMREHLYWDVEEDLSQHIGDWPAVWVMRVIHQVGDFLKTSWANKEPS